MTTGLQDGIFQLLDFALAIPLMEKSLLIFDCQGTTKPLSIMC